MRFVSMAVFLFCINIAMAITNSTGIFIATVNPSQTWMSSVNQQQVAAQSYAPNQVTTSLDYSLGDVVKGVFYFILSFGLSIVILPWTFVQFGMGWAMASLVSAPFYMMYVFGLAQWFANRSEKVMG